MTAVSVSGGTTRASLHPHEVAGFTRLRWAVWAVTVVAASQAFGRLLSVGGFNGYLLLTTWTLAAALILVLPHLYPSTRAIAQQPWFGLLLLWTSASIAWSQDHVETAVSVGVVAALLGAGVAAGVTAATSDLARVTCLVLTALGAVSVLVIATVPDAGLVTALESADGSTTWRVGVFGWNSAMGMSGAFAASIALGLGVGNVRSSRVRGLWLLVAAAGLVVVVTSRSATALLAVLSGVVAVLVLRFWWAKILAAVGTVALGFLWATSLLGPVTGWVLELMGRSPDLTGRVPIWNLMLMLTRNERLGGHGLGQSPDLLPFIGAEVPHSHNGYLQLLLELGWPGLALFILTLLHVGVRLWAQRDYAWFGVLTVLVVANFANHFAMSQSLATLFLGVLVATASKPVPALAGPEPRT